MKRVGILALGLMLAACSASTETVNKNDFDPAKIAYFKDARTDLCFAVVSYSRFDTGGKIAYGMSHSVVPCSPQVIALLMR